MDKNQNQNSSAIKTCKNCGVPLDPETRFCVNCGMPVEQEQEQPEPKSSQMQEELTTQEPIYQPPVFAAADDVPFPEENQTGQPPEHRAGQLIKHTGVFAGGILGFVVMAVLLAAVFVTGVFNEHFFTLGNIRFTYIQLMIFGTIACSAALTTRAKGPDLSVGAVIALSGITIAAMGDYWILGIIIAALGCIFIGAANGALVVYLKMPSLLVTLVTAAIFRGVAYLMSSGMPLQFGDKLAWIYNLRLGNFELLPLIIFAAAFITTFLFVLLSKLGKPIAKREAADNVRLSYFLAYVISAVIAGLLGFFMITFQRSAVFNGGVGYELFILLVFAAITSSRYIDNRAVPVIYSLLPALFYAILIGDFMLYNFGGSYLLQMVLAIVAIGLAIVSYIARKDSFRGIIQRL